ncbi:hypothetical protein AB1Y20_002801 [Prymnesium parvum]|uniref:Uncharacterized protein n=1 Tax=Prymnesium parvum TaxID=97485 RepID=A0AB34JCN8_PRYPA
MVEVATVAAGTEAVVPAVEVTAEGATVVEAQVEDVVVAAATPAGPTGYVEEQQAEEPMEKTGEATVEERRVAAGRAEVAMVEEEQGGEAKAVAVAVAQGWEVQWEGAGVVRGPSMAREAVHMAAAVEAMVPDDSAAAGTVAAELAAAETVAAETAMKATVGAEEVPPEGHVEDHVEEVRQVVMVVAPVEVEMLPVRPAGRTAEGPPAAAMVAAVHAEGEGSIRP